MKVLPILAIAAITVAGSAQAASIPPSTPPGVTLVEVAHELTLSQPDILWTRPGDAQGRTLFYSAGDAPGVAKCIGDCAKEFPPLLAGAGAKAAGDWTLVKRPDGGQQWAYQTHPLYIWSQEKVDGEVANNVGITEVEGGKLAEHRIPPGTLMPPAGWTVARFTPAATIALPAGINAQLVAGANGVVLTDYQNMTLYAFDGDARRDNQSCSDRGCRMTWLPVSAPDLAQNVGDFSAVVRADGSSQWAYRKQPLYRYNGDLLAGDVLGAAADKKWKVAMISENFHPAKVAVTDIEAYGNALTVNGMTLYGGYLSQKRWGGRNTRNGFRNGWSKGKALQGLACGDDKCLAEWKPFLAPADAQSSGFWEVYTRADGAKQWAYKGYALWTHVSDKKPGDITGQMTYDYAKLGGSEEDLKRMAFLAKISDDTIFGGSGIYWTLARP